MDARLASLRRLARETSGLAMIEFAVSLPVLLSLGLLGLEVANYGVANLRVSQIAMLVADNAGRVRDSIDEVDINEIMTGAKLIGGSIGFGANGRIILSSVEQNKAGLLGASTGQWIRWQRCSGAKGVVSAYGNEGKGQTDASLQYMGSSTQQIAALPGTAVMFVEVTYDYKPLVSNSLLGTRQLKYMSAFNVRQRTDQVLKNSNSLTTAQTSACSLYTP